MGARRALREHNPDLLVLAVNMPVNQGFQRFRAFEAVKAATAGRTYLDPLLGAQLAVEPAAHGPPEGLTRREVEVLQLLAAGHTNAEIGKELFMSVRTAETHRAQIQRKTRCSSRAQLTRYARGHGSTEN